MILVFYKKLSYYWEDLVEIKIKINRMKLKLFANQNKVLNMILKQKKMNYFLY